MRPRKILIAGDSNLKQLSAILKDDAIVLCVPGARVSHDKKRFVENLKDAVAMEKPNIVFLHIGSNDALSFESSEDFARVYRNLFDVINENSPSSLIGVCEVLPRAHNQYVRRKWNTSNIPRIQKNIAAMNVALNDMCQQPNRFFVDYGGLIESEGLARDGLHVNRRGALAMADKLMRAIKDMQHMIHSGKPDDTDVEAIPIMKERPTYAEVLKKQLAVSCSDEREDLLEKQEDATRGLSPRQRCMRSLRRPHRSRGKHLRKSSRRYISLDHDHVQLQVNDYIAVSLSARKIYCIFKGTGSNGLEKVQSHKEVTIVGRNVQKTASACKPKEPKLISCPDCSTTCHGEMPFLDHFIKYHSVPATQQQKHKSNVVFDDLQLHTVTKPTEPDMNSLSEMEWSWVFMVMFLGRMFGSVEWSCYLIYTHISQYCANLVRQQLLLSGDIEQNPGPNQVMCLWSNCGEGPFISARTLCHHITSHIFDETQLCLWSECCFHANNGQDIERHVLSKHVYLEAFHFTSFSDWEKQLPSGEFSSQLTDLHFCPPYLRSELDELLLDEEFKLPKGLYTVFDHQVYLNRLSRVDFAKYHHDVQLFINKYPGKWRDNSKEVSMDAKSFKAEQDRSRTDCIDILCQNDMYSLNTSVTGREATVTTGRPELVGNYQSSVKFKLHSTTTAKKLKRKEAVSMTQPWSPTLLSNLNNCRRAIETEVTALSYLSSNILQTKKLNYLIKMEKAAVTLASTSDCTDGIFLFNIFEVTCHNKVIFYIRYLESGYYEDFMQQEGLPILLDVLKTDRNSILVSKIATSEDIEFMRASKKGELKTPRPDKTYKNNVHLIDESKNKLDQIAQQLEVSHKYVIHSIRKGYKQCVDEHKTIERDWFFKSNFLQNPSDIFQEKLLNFHLNRLNEHEKNSFLFCAEELAGNSDLVTQCCFLNLLSNDPYRYSTAKELRFEARFCTSSILPASLRNQIIWYFRKCRTSDVISTFSKCTGCNEYSESCVVHTDVNPSAEKRPRKAAKDSRKKLVSVEALHRISNVNIQESVSKLPDLYDSFKSCLVHSGVLAVQQRSSHLLTAVMNDYCSETGKFHDFNYVYTTHRKSEAGPIFTCTCQIFSTLLECVTGEDDGELDALSDVKCMHCRFLKDDVLPLLERSTEIPNTMLKGKVFEALNYVNKCIIPLKARTGTKKFSVCVDDSLSFVHLSRNKRTQKYIVSCLDGFCRARKGSKKNIEYLKDGNTCIHLALLKNDGDLWNDDEVMLDIEDPVYNAEVEIDDDEDDFDEEAFADRRNQGALNFDVDSGLWSFPCRSTHSPRQEKDPVLAANIRRRDTWNDATYSPRVDGYLEGPDLFFPLQPDSDIPCFCGAGYFSDEHLDGRFEFDRSIMVYTLHAPVLCKVFSRLCLNKENPCRLKWDEGHSLCVHVVSKDTAAGDEIGWSFVNQVLNSKATFAGFCKNLTKNYEMRYPGSRSFMDPSLFIKWWFSWASKMETDFRKPCPVCKFTPKQLACDGTRMGIGFRHATFSDISDFDDHAVIETKNRRMDRCFISNKLHIEPDILNTCREHLLYLACEQLYEEINTIPADEKFAKTETLKELLHVNVLPSFSRYISGMKLREKLAYANVMKMLATTAPVVSFLPLSHINCIQGLMDFLQNKDNNFNVFSHMYFNSTLGQMRKYAPELRNLIASSASANQNSLPADIIKFIKHLISIALSLDVVQPEPAEVQPGTYNPAKYGRAYYFSPSGCKLRNVRKFSIDEKNKNRNAPFDDRPMNFDMCEKYFSKTHIAARGSTTLFLWFCPNHGHCYGFHMTTAEGRKDPYASLYSHLELPPEDIFYDFACNLQEYCLNRESGFFKNVHFFHDIFHGYSHKCSAAYKSCRLDGYKTVNSEICEQFNSFVQCIKASARQMTQEHFTFYLQFFLNIWNEKKEANFNKKLAVALAGTNQS